MKEVIITRRVELSFDTDDKEMLRAYYKRWFELQNKVREAANLISTHLYLQNNTNQVMNYMDQEVLNRLVDKEKNDAGILNTSAQNSTYRMVSDFFANSVPTSILTSLNSKIAKTYKKEAFDVSIGKRSLRNYRNSIPIPFTTQSIRHLKKADDGNYTFTMFSVPFKTYFGKDLSNNEDIMDRAVSGEYKICDSEITIRKKRVKTKDGKSSMKYRLFFGLVIKMPQMPYTPKKGKTAYCELSVQNPIIIKDGKDKDKDFLIGNMEEYLHGRLSINNACKRLQQQLKYAKGGKGRKKKLQALDRFKEKEKHFIDSRLHKYSRELINYCVKNKVEKIVLCNYKLVQSVCEDDKLLLPNWSYYNLSDKIIYKAAMLGIIVELEDKEGKDKPDKNESLELEVQDLVL